FKLILGREQPDEGTVEFDHGTTFGYFSQFSELGGDESILDLLEHEFRDVHELEGKLKKIEEEISKCASEKELKALVGRQTKMFAEMDLIDGWNYKYKISTVLSKLNFSEEHRNLPAAQLSGGWRNRASLALLLIREPNVMLLDEPTNFLDAEGVAWLAEWIKKSKAAVVAVSHDRNFLDGAAARIVEIENNRLHEYTGGYPGYVRQRKLKCREIEREFVHEEELLVMEENAIKDRAELQKLIKNNRAGRGKLEKKISAITKKITPSPAETIVTSLYRGRHVPDRILNAEGLSACYGDNLVFESVSFELFGGERMAVVGRNGCGKTTLIKTLTGEIEPFTGRLAWAPGSKMIYFNEILDGLDEDDTVTHNINVYGDAYGAQRKKVNAFLKLFGFSDFTIADKIGNLSGGQKARVALAKCLLSGCNTIILDEPTNHLDITSIQGMECALVNFAGTVIFVSHDTFFIDKTATRLLVYRDGTFINFPGNYSMYAASL
ncbi:MAG: ATP-binding cassette domain-containing protein, partial [Defluviitaleaceae bacterium]|nr:ATP-binding cassette domain-containing protein [Defluviitaleaceae bacterium]